MAARHSSHRVWLSRRDHPIVGVDVAVGIEVAHREGVAAIPYEACQTINDCQIADVLEHQVFGGVGNPTTTVA